MKGSTNVIRSASKTKHPAIFKHTYWGSFKESEFSQEIYNNRNRLVQEFDIKKVYEVKNYGKFFHTADMDHFELYITGQKKIVALFSNYTDTDLSRLHGFDKYLKLYHESAITFIRVFENVKSLDDFLKTIKPVYQLKRCPSFDSD